LGNGVTAALLVDAWGQPIRPANFTLAAGTPGGVTLGHDGRHLFKTISVGIGGGPMPPFAQALTPAQIWDLVHYVQSLRVDAHVASLKEVGLTDPGQTASFCKSTVPWLQAACKSVVLPIVQFCSAGEPLPPKPQNARFQLSEARKRIWASLSDAANRDQIDPAVLAVDQPAPTPAGTPPPVAATAPTTAPNTARLQ
jgi:hypothetical protein